MKNGGGGFHQGRSDCKGLRGCWSVPGGPSRSQRLAGQGVGANGPFRPCRSGERRGSAHNMEHSNVLQALGIVFFPFVESPLKIR